MENKIRISLAAARVNAGLTQREAAKALNVNVATIQNYESGKTSPTWEVMRRIETLYGIPIDCINLRRD